MKSVIHWMKIYTGGRFFANLQNLIFLINVGVSQLKMPFAEKKEWEALLYINREMAMEFTPML